MKLSDEEKDALAEHFKGKDLYDPSKAPEQDPANFAPCTCGAGHEPGMCKGGEMGYAAGGDVLEADPAMFSDAENFPAGPEPLDLRDAPADIARGSADRFQPSSFAGPALSADTQTARVPLAAAPGGEAKPPLQLSSLGEQPIFGAEGQPGQAVAGSALPRPSLLDAPGGPGKSFHGETDKSAASPIKSLKSDEYNQLLQYLQPSRGQRVGNAAMSGLAGLADAIMTGVAKAPSSNFQKNLSEKDSAERKDLMEALRQKYEANFKGRELDQSSKRLAEEVRAHGASEKHAGAQLDEEKRGHDLEAGYKRAQLGAEQGKMQIDAAHKIIEAYEKGSGIGNALGLSERPSSAEYDAAKKVIQSVGAVGMQPLTATNKQTGQRIMSTDGGKTWKEMK